LALNIKHSLRDVFGRFIKKDHVSSIDGRSPYHDIWQAAINKGLTPGLEKRARDWMRDAAKNVLVPNDPMTVIRNEKGMERRQILPGFMYMYQYDAKTKDELPYWDKFPLVFPFSMHSDGFTGINLHYLPRPLRARLMDALHKLVVNKKYNDNQRLALSYQLLKSSSDFAPFKPCVKRYLYSHIRSKYYKVPSEKWDVALFLPTERFQKATKTAVWAESQKIINKAKK
jgi:hypothetical protein